MKLPQTQEELDALEDKFNQIIRGMIVGTGLLIGLMAISAYIYQFFK
jgi:hypothetical protein